MRPRLPAVVAVVLVVATVATGTPVPSVSDSGATAQTTTDGQVNLTTVANTTNYLGLPGRERTTSRFGNATLDVTAATAMETEQLQTRFNTTVALRAFASAPNRTRRTAIIERAATRVQNRTQHLENRQARAIRQYNQGSISTDVFLQRLAVIHAESRYLTDSIDTLLQRASGYSVPNSLRTRLEGLKAKPATLRGTIHSRVAGSLSGEDAEFTVYVETTTGGYVLARIADGRYVREASLAANYREDGIDQFTQEIKIPTSAASDYAGQLYPWGISHLISRVNPGGYGDTSIYRITIGHTQGRLESYISGVTKRVFRETQNKRLSRIPINGTATNTTTALNITANLTHKTGPMQLTVSRDEIPVDARITINGQFVGRTGIDGQRWTIRPHGPVTVTATSANESVRLQLPGRSP